MKKGFTLIELLVVIAIIAILAAILFPVFAQARDKARQSACLSNTKQIATAFQLYADDYDETMPCSLDQDGRSITGDPYGFGDMWCWNPHAIQSQLYPYCKNYSLFVCASAVKLNKQQRNDYCQGHEGESYLWNGGIFDANHGSQALASLKNPSSIALAIEMKSEDCWNRMVPYWHSSGCWNCHPGYPRPIHASETLVNIPFADGHAKGVKFSMIETKDLGFYRGDGSSRQWCLNGDWNQMAMNDCVFGG